MTMNIRLKNDPESLAYSPQRDLAYVGPTMLRMAAAMVDSEYYWNTNGADLEKAGVTQEQFGQVAAVIGQALVSFMTSPRIAKPEDALDEAGYQTIPGLASKLYFSVFGEVVFLAMLRGIRETGRMNEDAPAQLALADTVEYVASFLRKRGYTIPEGIDSAALNPTDMKLTIAHNNAMIESLQKELDALYTAQSQSSAE